MDDNINVLTTGRYGVGNLLQLVMGMLALDCVKLEVEENRNAILDGSTLTEVLVEVRADEEGEAGGCLPRLARGL
jgi:hypothetical protein